MTGLVSPHLEEHLVETKTEVKNGFDKEKLDINLITHFCIMARLEIVILCHPSLEVPLQHCVCPGVLDIVQ